MSTAALLPDLLDTPTAGRPALRPSPPAPAVVLVWMWPPSAGGPGPDALAALAVHFGGQVRERTGASLAATFTGPGAAAAAQRAARAAAGLRVAPAGLAAGLDAGVAYAVGGALLGAAADRARALAERAPSGAAWAALEFCAAVEGGERFPSVGAHFIDLGPVPVPVRAVVAPPAALNG